MDRRHKRDDEDEHEHENLFDDPNVEHEEDEEEPQEEETPMETESMRMMGAMMERMFEKMERARERERKLERDRASRKEKVAEERRREEREKEEERRMQREAEMEMQKQEDRRRQQEHEALMHKLREQELQLKERELQMMAEKEERSNRLLLEREQHANQLMKEREDRKERLAAIQMPAPMTAKTDLLEYLELFEQIANTKEIPQEARAIALLLLLNDKYRTAAVKLPADVQADYDQLKEALRDHDESNIRDAAVTFWNHCKKSGTSALEERQTLIRLGTRFINGDDRQTCVDQVVKEWMVQRLPKEARQYVRERTPESSMDAVKLIEKFFSA